MSKFCEEQKHDIVNKLLKYMHPSELIDALLDTIPENEIIEILEEIADDFDVSLDDEDDEEDPWD